MVIKQQLSAVQWSEVHSPAPAVQHFAAKKTIGDQTSRIRIGGPLWVFYILAWLLYVDRVLFLLVGILPNDGMSFISTGVKQHTGAALMAMDDVLGAEAFSASAEAVLPYSYCVWVGI